MNRRLPFFVQFYCPDLGLKLRFNCRPLLRLENHCKAGTQTPTESLPSCPISSEASSTNQLRSRGSCDLEVTPSSKVPFVTPTH